MTTDGRRAQGTPRTDKPRTTHDARRIPRVRESALVAYMVGVPLAVLGALFLLVVRGTVGGGAVFIGGILFVCTAMIVGAIERTSRG